MAGVVGLVCRRAMLTRIPGLPYVSGGGIYRKPRMRSRKRRSLAGRANRLSLVKAVRIRRRRLKHLLPTYRRDRWLLIVVCWPGGDRRGCDRISRAAGDARRSGRCRRSARCRMTPTAVWCGADATLSLRPTRMSVRRSPIRPSALPATISRAPIVISSPARKNSALRCLGSMASSRSTARVWVRISPSRAASTPA